MTTSVPPVYPDSESSWGATEPIVQATRLPRDHPYEADKRITHHQRDARDLATFDLLQELELLRWDRLRMREREVDPDSMMIVESAIAALQAEVESRRRLLNRYRGDPLAPTWPDARSERYERMKQTARDLKTLWPIDRFVTDMVGVDLAPAGRSLKGRCPLPDHDERTPSFHVYPAPDDRWHCYGCNRGGDIFELVGLLTGADSFRRRLEYVRDATPGLIGGGA